CRPGDRALAGARTGRGLRVGRVGGDGGLRPRVVAGLRFAVAVRRRVNAQLGGGDAGLRGAHLGDGAGRPASLQVAGAFGSGGTRVERSGGVGLGSCSTLPMVSSHRYSLWPVAVPLASHSIRATPLRPSLPSGSKNDCTVGVMLTMPRRRLPSSSSTSTRASWGSCTATFSRRAIATGSA